MSEAIEIRQAGAGDVAVLQELARTIWHAHYPGIIGLAQIEYMLDQRYRTEVVQRELERGDLWWELAAIARSAVGFSSCLLSGVQGEMKLDKLYVLPERQRHGVGRALLDSVRERARSYGCTRLILCVNKHNSPAIAAYLRCGFRIERALVTDIGGGFAMDDYQMVCEP